MYLPSLVKLLWVTEEISDLFYHHLQIVIITCVERSLSLTVVKESLKTETKC